MDTLPQEPALLSIVEWLGVLTGIAAVALSIRQKVLAWPGFILCYACYVFISYASGLIAFMGLNVVFIGLSVYGWIQWAQGADKVDKAIHVSRTARCHWPVVIILIVTGTLGLGWLLSRAEGASYPHLDGLAVFCALVAQWMLSRKHVESWLFWIISDLIYLTIFALAGLWPSVFLFAIFTALAIKGWVEWNRDLKPSVHTAD